MRTVATLILCLCAAPASAQVYVGAAAGIDTTLASQVELEGQTRADAGGTTPSLAVRAGLGLGDRWGAEFEVSHALTLDRSETAGRGEFGPSLVTGLGALRFGSVGEPILLPDFRLNLRIDSERTVTAVNALAWIRYPLGARIDLVFLGGASFNRSQVDQRYGIETPLPPGFPSGSFTFSIQAASVRLVTYDVGPMVGAEARIAFGDHLRLVPGFRMSGVGGGWALRPTAGAAWSF